MPRRCQGRVGAVISRSPTGRSHPKLREVIQPKSFSYSDLGADISSCDACFFCLGVSSVGMTATTAAPTALSLDDVGVGSRRVRPVPVIDVGGRLRTLAIYLSDSLVLRPV